ncbi:MAG: glycine zipper 2TM domain-containing protein [Sphingomonadales bacterium]|nr:glycine zipper 2TM domain-containing protein [Sphingomonadales bacterium]
MERVCGRRDTATGAIIGGLLGGVAGNRIAGRGNRTEGTIIGGVVGAAAGAAVGSAADRERCDRWWESSDGYDHRPSAHGPRHPQGHGYPAAYPGYGYYYPAYYYPAPTVTTVIIEGGGCGCQQVTETVTTTEYETVYTAPAKRVRRYAAPAPTKRVATKGKRVYRK